MAADALPPGLDRLTALEFLYLKTQTPIQLPTTLSSLHTLHVLGEGFQEAQRAQQRWDWLAPLTRLHSLRIQGAGLRELPQEVAQLHLTRLR